MTAMRRLLANLALVAAGIVLAFIIAEVALRVLVHRPVFYIYDRYAGWTLNPGAAGWNHEESTAWVAVNREGLRGPEISAAKPPGTIRVAVLGDSFTEAQQVGYSSTFCAMMQRKLGECLKPRAVQVLNFGVDGYGTTQELATLEHRVWQFGPDAVVLAFFTGNDFRNNSVALEGDRCRPFFVMRGGAMVPGGPFDDSAWFRFKCRMRFDSRRWRGLAFLSKARDVIRDRIRARRERKHPAIVGREIGISEAIYRPPADQAWRDAWEVTERQLLLMNREVASHHVPFLLVTLTNGIQVYPDPAVRAAYARHLGVSNLLYPDERLMSFGKREGIAVLSLAEPMQRWADQHHESLHGFRNGQKGAGHWNAAGHQVAGTLIAERLCAMLGKPAQSAVGASRSP